MALAIIATTISALALISQSEIVKHLDHTTHKGIHKLKADLEHLHEKLKHEQEHSTK